jgi:hypothetical protein
MASRLNEEEIQSLVVKLQKKLNKVVVQAREREEEKKKATGETFAIPEDAIPVATVQKEVLRVIPVSNPLISSDLIPADIAKVLSSRIETDDQLRTILKLIGYEMVNTSPLHNLCLFNSIFTDERTQKDTKGQVMFNMSDGLSNAYMQQMRIRSARNMKQKMMQGFKDEKPPPDNLIQVLDSINIEARLKHTESYFAPEIDDDGNEVDISWNFQEIIDLITYGHQVSPEALMSNISWETIDNLKTDVACSEYIRSPVWIIIRATTPRNAPSFRDFDLTKQFFGVNVDNNHGSQFRDFPANQAGKLNFTGLTILEALFNLEPDTKGYPLAQEKYPELLYYDSNGDNVGHYTRITRRDKSSTDAPYERFREWFYSVDPQVIQNFIIKS